MAEFVHEKELIGNHAQIEKFKRRILKFAKFIHKDNTYLYCLNSSSISDQNQAIYFLTTIKDFLGVISENSTLCVYIRYDNDKNFKSDFCNSIKSSAENSNQVQIVNYCRDLDVFGIWGNERTYPILLKSLGIKIRITFPRFTIS